LGQHSYKPSRPNPANPNPHTPNPHTLNSAKPNSDGRQKTSTKRRWATVAVGAAVVAAASTTAWAAVANDDTLKTTSALELPPANTPSATSQPNTASRSAASKPLSGPKAASQAKTETTSPKVETAAPKAEAAAPKAVTTKAANKPAATPVRKAKTEAAKPKTRVLSTGTCGASFYGEPQMTASGERFDPSAMTAAHKTLPLGSRVRVTNPSNGESVTVRINDRGPYVGGRCLDLSEAAFAAIGNTGAGVMRVKYEVLARS
jgi:rare lipoprotein A